ncbi:MAG TPA: hypothetical protein PK359_14735 [Burkholderiaceae bacterium]|jgi:uncharacterized membrane protein|nr:hypothetical protein [Burkholderiaceae bacterium]
MSQIVPQASSPHPAPDERLRRICQLDYGLHIFGLLFSLGLLSVVALIINYIKRDEAAGTIYASHMSWMIATFWWTLFWVVVLFVPNFLLSIVSFGLLSWLFLLPGVWFLYRMLKGLLRLSDNRPIP